MDEYINKFIEGFNNFLVRKGREKIQLNDVILSKDEDLSYDNWTILREKLISAEKFQEVFSEGLKAGPFWIHANLVPLEDSRQLITICMGKGEGCSQPRIDLSIEINKVVKII